MTFSYIFLFSGATYKFRIVAVYSNNDNAPGDNSDPFTLVSNGDHRSVKRLIDGPTIVKVEELVVDKIYAIVVEWKVMVSMFSVNHNI